MEVLYRELRFMLDEIYRNRDVKLFFKIYKAVCDLLQIKQITDKE